MSYADLYRYCQDLTPPISRKLLIPKVCELTGEQQPILRVHGLDPAVIAGFIVWPGNSAHPFAHHCGTGPTIVVARNLNYCWRRFVVIKELMHYFDAVEERLKLPDAFEGLLSEFGAPLPVRSKAMNSEIFGLWMALGVICPELLRQNLQRKREAQAITDLEIAHQLKMPESYVPALFDPMFKIAIQAVLASH